MKKKMNLSFNEQVKIVERGLRDAVRFEKLDMLGEFLNLLKDAEVQKVIKASDRKKVIDADINAYMHLASIMGSDEVLKKLIKFGADVNSRNANGETPLHNAVRYNRTACIKALLESEGISPNEKNMNGDAPLHLINYIKDCKENSIRELIGSPKIKLEEKNGNGRTALFEAVEYQNKMTAKLLLEAGADANTEHDSNSACRSALSTAVANYDLDMAEMLLDKGADPYKFGYRCISPAVYAVADDYQECIKMFLDKGVDLSVEDKMFKKSPLQIADESGRDEVAKIIRNDIASKAAKKINAYKINFNK